MSGPHPLERRRSLILAGHRADAATARAGLVDPDPDLRSVALGACARAGALADEDLRAALADPDAGVRRRAAELAGAAPGVDLAGILDDPDPLVAETAAWALGERPAATPTEVAHLAAVATGHADALVREAAVAALGSLGDPAGLDAVLAACTDRATVRRRAVLALAPFDDPRVEDALERARHDRDRQVRQAAEDLLG